MKCDRCSNDATTHLCEQHVNAMLRLIYACRDYLKHAHERESQASILIDQLDKMIDSEVKDE